jgi:hypothetical protein
LVVIVTIYLIKYFTQFWLTAKIGGYQPFNMNDTCKEWDIIFMLTFSMNNSYISQEAVLDDGRK